MYAIRNIRLCTKDCLCLYVCPTGAADTETGQIDAGKCTACGACVSACPSHAISMQPTHFPPQQPKAEAVQAAGRQITRSKARQEQIARQIAEEADDPLLRQLARAIELSSRLAGEDAARESGYMLPQSANTHALLKELQAESPYEDFPAEIVEELLMLIQPNE